MTQWALLPQGQFWQWAYSLIGKRSLKAASGANSHTLPTQDSTNFSSWASSFPFPIQVWAILFRAINERLQEALPDRPWPLERFHLWASLMQREQEYGPDAWVCTGLKNPTASSPPLLTHTVPRGTARRGAWSCLVSQVSCAKWFLKGNGLCCYIPRVGRSHLHLRFMNDICKHSLRVNSSYDKADLFTRTFILKHLMSLLNSSLLNLLHRVLYWEVGIFWDKRTSFLCFAWLVYCLTLANIASAPLHFGFPNRNFPWS